VPVSRLNHLAALVLQTIECMPWPDHFFAHWWLWTFGWDDNPTFTADRAFLAYMALSHDAA